MAMFVPATVWCRPCAHLTDSILVVASSERLRTSGTLVWKKFPKPGARNTRFWEVEVTSTLSPTKAEYGHVPAQPQNGKKATANT